MRRGRSEGRAGGIEGQHAGVEAAARMRRESACAGGPSRSGGGLRGSAAHRSRSVERLPPLPGQHAGAREKRCGESRRDVKGARALVAMSDVEGDDEIEQQ